ncbi:MAG TPA: ubiquitin-conjugating enzyme E2 [Thermoplasmata archaeon]
MCQRELRHHISISDATLSAFPISVNVTLLRIPGPDWEEGKVVHRFVHRLAIVITEDYPIEKPIVSWQTPIFHPNIMPPEDGGYVCTRLLEKWDFSSTLLTFIKGIESLLVNPNPRSPFGNDRCTRAAAYFNRYKYRPPVVMDQSDRRVRILGDADV